MTADRDGRTRVIVVGGGFAGVACATRLARHRDVAVTLVDRNDYHQFQPLLYQVATCQLAATDVAYPLHRVALAHGGFDVRRGEVAAIDPGARTVTLTTGETLTGEVLVLAAGSQPFFFKTPGAAEHAFPLYSLDDATRLRSRILQLFEEADRDPARIDAGALEFVVVGGGPTGVEVSGALAEMIATTLATEYPHLAASRARVSLVDHGHALLAPFSPGAHEYAADVLARAGVRLRLGTGVTEVGPGHVVLSDGTTVPTRCVIWGGGLTAAPIASAARMPTGRGGRIDVLPDLTVAGFPGVYVVGDIANIPTPEGGTFPQLGSVAQQSGAWAARNIVDDLAGKARSPFKYTDKGIMAMIGRGSAIAEVGHGRAHQELHGTIAFAAWLGVHAALMSGFRNRIDAFVDWAWDYFGTARGPQVLDRSDAARIDWTDDDSTASPAGPADAAPNGGGGT